ncbi:MAG: hypothetical protein K2H20_00190 [Bacilli bacterium]|nr:hypothetical protein [Bacilli bacterium]
MLYTLFGFGDALKEGFIGIILTLDTLIYGLISSSFKVFMAIAGARLLSSDAYFDIANKIYVIVGVLMLFVLSYAILKAIVDPDQTTKGEFGPKMIKNVVIAVVGLAIAPVLFNFMYQAQGLILEQDVLGKLFFRIENTEKVDTGGSVSNGNETVSFDSQVNPDEYVKSIGGAVTATSLWQAFFYPAEDSGKTAAEIVADPSDYFVSGVVSGLLCAGSVALAFVPGIRWLAIGAAVATCTSAATNIVNGVEASQITDGEVSLQQAYAMASAGEGFGIFTVFLHNYIEDGEITYLFGISTIAGAFALFAFVSFSIDMGVRAAKLAYLQIIAPVPLVMQVLPKFKENFNSYIKSVTSTFIEVFVRISVVYVVVYIICHLTDLFSSVSNWSQTNGLNFAEQLFALAFLILGLIAFCRKAPEIITETLHLPKGNMHLGIGKKLADGGFYAAKSIAGGGMKAGVRNWTATRDKNAGLGKRALSFLGGVGSGAARATMMNFGPGHKPAETWKQSGDISENAAQGANDAHDKRWERMDKHEAAVAARNEAWKKYKDAYDEWEAAKGTPEERAKEAAMNAAKEAYSAANAAAYATTAIGAMQDQLQRKTKAWTTGTVSTANEEAAIRFGDSLDALKGKLREEAYKKDTYGASMLKQQYERLKSQPAREYAEGWDEQSYNAEYRRRQQTVLAAAGVQQGLTDLASAKTKLDADREALDRLAAQGLTAGNAQFDAAKAQFDLSKQSLENVRNTLKSKLNATGMASLNDDKIVLDMSDIKVDVATATAERAREVEALRVAMEAAADAWVHENAAKAGSNTNRDIQLFISENASYINEHQNDSIVVGYDGDNPIKKTISEVIKQGFGEKAVTSGKFEFTTTAEKDSFTSQRDFEIEYADGKGKVIYKKDGDYYYPYDKDGKKITDPAYEVYEEKSIFEGIRRGVVEGKLKGASSKSAISKAADAGKQAATYTKTHELADKKLIQRQAQENKGGKK